MNYNKHLIVVAGDGKGTDCNDTLRRVDTLHKEWADCSKCQIGIWAAKKVHLRGTVPCDLLFIGEAPGVSENMVGAPFVGSSGEILDVWIERATQALGLHMPVWAITNTVACRPCGRRAGANRAPTDQEQSNCWLRFREVMSIARPKMVVALGRVATDYWLSQEITRLYPSVQLSHELYHPAYVGRKGGKESKASYEMSDSLIRFLKRHI